MVYNTIVINKKGTQSFKKCLEPSSLYKTCSYRKPDNFVCHKEWPNLTLDKSIYSVQLWGKNTGIKSNINTCNYLTRYTSEVIYGSFCLIFYINNKLQPVDATLFALFNKYQNGVNVPQIQQAQHAPQAPQATQAPQACINTYLTNDSLSENNSMDESLTDSEYASDSENDLNNTPESTNLPIVASGDNFTINNVKNESLDNYSELTYEKYYYSSQDK